ncbi:hypothetical protein FRY98_02660 [Paenibacillus faecis]|uniref:Uncharacterized protein n=1 Tax=Paenibacillus faecis TaxID=862114 RepID=A0A5D0CZ67_9BACL|nr:YiiX/YebB-like N1pC/P60 family cysteine hydrolase [Paenibacillus faecis]TYA14604.1 hypothetical protein FRY98_02660 [Paenibacillus faecis]
MIKSASSIILAFGLILSCVAAPVSAATADKDLTMSLIDKDSNMLLTNEDLKHVSNEPRTPEQYLSKTDLIEKIKEADAATGKDNFLNVINSTDSSIMNAISFNQDGTLRVNKSKIKANDEVASKEIENVENALKEYTDKLKEFNKKQGIESNGLDITPNGEISISGNIGGNGDGVNSLTLQGRDKGDIVLQNDPGLSIQGYINHAGIYDGTTSDVCIYTAQPDIGVTWETVDQWRNHDDAYVLTTGYTTATQASAFNWAYSLAGYGETYYWYAGKDDDDSWYCSKVAWRGYDMMAIDLDYNGGYWVFPDDILQSSKTYLAAAYY